MSADGFDTLPPIAFAPAPRLEGDWYHCPCGAKHDRGPLNGVDVYRCLRCGDSHRIPVIVNIDTTTPLPPTPRASCEVVIGISDASEPIVCGMSGPHAHDVAQMRAELAAERTRAEKAERIMDGGCALAVLTAERERDAARAEVATLTRERDEWRRLLELQVQYCYPCAGKGTLVHTFDFDRRDGDPPTPCSSCAAARAALAASPEPIHVGRRSP